jgi:hypothetical protein
MGQPRHEPSRGERIGRRQNEPPAGAAAAYLVQRLGKGLEAVANNREKLLTCSRECQRARPASKQ